MTRARLTLGQVFVSFHEVAAYAQYRVNPSRVREADCLRETAGPGQRSVGDADS